jgi:hypothetical protein
VSKHAFDPNCPDCRPVILDAKTMKPYAADSVVMAAVNKVWETASREEQEAFHRTTVLNGRDPGDMRLLKQLSDRMSKAIGSN